MTKDDEEYQLTPFGALQLVMPWHLAADAIEQLEIYARQAANEGETAAIVFKEKGGQFESVKQEL